MQILFCGNGWLPIVELIAAKRPADEVAVWDRDTALSEVARTAEVILPSNGLIGAEVIGAARKLVLIQQPAAGFDCVDLDAARTHGVPVCNAPGGNTIAVAEAATYLMLALARRAPEAAKAFAAGELGVPLGLELHTRTLGLVGFGATAQAFATIAAGIGMKILHVTSSSSTSELDALLATADVVSLHCPLNDATRGMVGDSFLARMKPRSHIINCARGAIVVRDALEAALESGHLGGAGLDTHWAEPWNANDPIYLRPNVVTLPHVAGSTLESFERITDIVCENIRRVEAGMSLLHRIV